MIISSDLQRLAVPITLPILDPKNANTAHDIKGIGASLLEYGQLIPIVINSETNIILKGNGTFQAALAIGATHIAVVKAELDQKKSTGFAINDNRLGRKSKWDYEILLENLKSLGDYVIPEMDKSFLDEVYKFDTSKVIEQSQTDYQEPAPVLFQPSKTANDRLVELQQKLGTSSLEETLEKVISDSHKPTVSNEVMTQLAQLQKSTGGKTLEETLTQVIESTPPVTPAPKDKDETYYTRKIESPVYQITGDKPDINSLYNPNVTQKLLNRINTSTVSEADKEFLRYAAMRHTVLNFKHIAEYYAHADEQLQNLMEESALIIIDFDKAIELGLVELTEEISSYVKEDYPDDEL